MKDKKSFAIGFVIGVALFFVSVFLIFLWVRYHPETDCDSCLMGTTP